MLRRHYMLDDRPLGDLFTARWAADLLLHHFLLLGRPDPVAVHDFSEHSWADQEVSRDCAQLYHLGYWKCHR